MIRFVKGKMVLKSHMIVRLVSTPAIGLSANRLFAWRGDGLPATTTGAGGGVELTGLRTRGAGRRIMLSEELLVIVKICCFPSLCSTASESLLGIINDGFLIRDPSARKQ